MNTVPHLENNGIVLKHTWFVQPDINMFIPLFSFLNTAKHAQKYLH